MGRRTEQVELRVADLGLAHVPSTVFAAGELVVQALHDLIELARAP